MKKAFSKNREKFSRQSKMALEDLRYLQKKISGKSVYKSNISSYSRKPKHRKLSFQYLD